MSEDILRYPIGKFQKPGSVSPADIQKWLGVIEHLPLKMREAVNGLNPDQLDTRYRDGGWTLRQVVHHVADSHLNSYVRYKLALTEDNPTIKPYKEELWAELPEARNATVEISLRVLEALHARWVMMMRALTSDQWARTYHNPESGKTYRLDEALALYAWHSEHHLAHITNTRKARSW